MAPHELSDRALEVPESNDAVINVILLRAAARSLPGDAILCDVAHEDASVVLADLRDLDIPRRGSIAIEEVDTSLSTAASRAVRLAAGRPAEAVVWGGGRGAHARHGVAIGQLAGLALRATGVVEAVSGEGDLAALIANPDTPSPGLQRLLYERRRKRHLRER